MNREETFHDQCVEQVMKLGDNERENCHLQLSQYKIWMDKIRKAAAIQLEAGTLDLDSLFAAIDFYYHEVSLRRSSEFANSPTGDFVYEIKNAQVEHEAEAPLEVDGELAFGSFHNQCVEQVMHLDAGEKEMCHLQLAQYKTWMNKIRTAAHTAKGLNILDLDSLFNAMDFYYHEVSLRRSSEFANSPTGDFVYGVDDYLKSQNEVKTL